MATENKYYIWTFKSKEGGWGYYPVSKGEFDSRVLIAEHDPDTEVFYTEESNYLTYVRTKSGTRERIIAYIEKEKVNG